MKRILNYEIAAYLILIAISLLMRIWDLGDRSFGYDESLHAYYSYQLSQGAGFHHSPLMHGPLQFHGIAVLFFLFGDSDYTARLLSAIFGTALVAIPYFFRDRLGYAGAFLCSLMLAFSPMMFFYSRYARNDIIMAVWTLAIITLIWRYFDEGKTKYLYSIAAILALSFATKETTFIVLFITIGYLAIISSTDWITWLLRRPRQAIGNNENAEHQYIGLSRYTNCEFCGTHVNFSEDICSNCGTHLTTQSEDSDTTDRMKSLYLFQYGKSSNRHSLSGFSRAGVLLIILVTLSAPQLSAVFSALQSGLSGCASELHTLEKGVPLANGCKDGLLGKGIILANMPSLTLTNGPVGAPAGDILFTLFGTTITKGMAIAGILVAGILWLSVLLGTSWHKTIWVKCAVIFYTLWILLHTTFLTNMAGIGSGVWQSLGYWLMQQGEQRGSQPWYYYFVVTPIYETLPLVISLIAIIYYVVRGNNFSRFLVYWLVLTLIIYSWAGEKMPWLVVNITLPMIIISGKFLGDMLTTIPWHTIAKKGGLYLILIPPALIYLCLMQIFSSGDHMNSRGFLSLWIQVATIITLLGTTIFIFWRIKLSNGLVLCLFSVSLLLFTIGIRTGWHANYINEDVPKEMIVYAQGSPDVSDVINKIQHLPQKNTDIQKIKLTVDKDIYWGMLWDIRRFSDVEYADVSQISEPPESSVLIISDQNEQAVSPYIEKYDEQEDFLYLWWPGEGYKPCTSPDANNCFDLNKILPNMVNRDTWRNLMDYYLFRKTNTEAMFHNAIAYFDHK